MKLLIFTLAALLPMVTLGEYTPNNLRYISGYDYEVRMTYFFVEAYKEKQNSSRPHTCFGDEMALGFNSPAQGQAQVSNPSNSLIKLIQNCVNQSFGGIDYYLTYQNPTLEHAKAIYKRFFPSEHVEKYVNEGNKSSYFRSHTRPASEDEIKAQIQFTVKILLGTPENIQSYGLIKDYNQFLEYLQKKVSTESSLQGIQVKLFNYLVLRDEFLTY